MDLTVSRSPQRTLTWEFGSSTLEFKSRENAPAVPWEVEDSESPAHAVAGEACEKPIGRCLWAGHFPVCCHASDFFDLSRESELKETSNAKV